MKSSVVVESDNEVAMKEDAQRKAAKIEISKQRAKRNPEALVPHVEGNRRELTRALSEFQMSLRAKDLLMVAQKFLEESDYVKGIVSKYRKGILKEYTIDLVTK